MSVTFSVNIILELVASLKEARNLLPKRNVLF